MSRKSFIHPSPETLLSLYESKLRPLLFQCDSEWIHNRTLDALGWAAKDRFWQDVAESFFSSPEVPVDLFGLRFPNPVGLAAGMDKRAAALPMWEKLGFGFSELGGVTCLEQPGNPAPRMFRAVPHEALINRMGFNNPGAQKMEKQLLHWKRSDNWPVHPVGMNLGKSKLTPLDQAAEDYADSFLRLHRHVDFFVVNVSSPNTPNLRQLQDKDALREILQRLNGIRKRLETTIPVLVKVAPDLTFEALDEILELCIEEKLDGIVCSNTTIARPESDDPALQSIFNETGGLSGRPVAERSTELIAHCYKTTNGNLPIIGVGGIFSAEDAWKKILAGASLVQIYSGLVYKGPGLPAAINQGIVQRLHQTGAKNLSDVVGTAVK